MDIGRIIRRIAGKWRPRLRRDHLPGEVTQCRAFNFHPDTGVQLIGRNIPRWDELIRLAKELALVTEQKYVSWDLALTDAGWVMVEANYKGQLAQEGNRQGLRSELSRYFDC